ncbi:MAG: bifunctional folylpolyglutamate synthase/dihydrofolate synthase [Clostridia bacterium]|nr:bifunctional folylpolyglutamate synthase/dihydrofolate synthase [Clostridia bacterium]
MTYVNALKKIYSFPKTAGAPTLERMRLLCKYLGDPQKKLKFVHIAGTNGKGSCAAMLDSVLRDAGYRVGRYISPYILDFRERMTFDGEMISHEELCEHTKIVLDAVSKLEADVKKAREGEETPFPIPKAMLDGTSSDMPVQFEVVTAIGFLFFLQKRCDVVLLECGLGGKFDATNVIDPPLAAVIMGIGLDHTELLGDTVEKIAAEKCGIIKKGTQEIISYPQQPSVMSVIGDACVRANARISVPLKTELNFIHASLGGLDFKYKGKYYFSKLAAYYQLNNAATVIEVCEALRRVGMDISEENIKNGLAKTFFPGRFEVLGVSPSFIVDGAHNEHGVKAFCESVMMVSDAISGDVTFVLGMLKDKDPGKALMPFVELALGEKIRTKRIITLTPDSPRAMRAEELAALLSELVGGKIEMIPIGESEKARNKALFSLLSDTKPNDAVISFGSLYLAAEMRLVLGEFLENYRPEI